MSLIVDETNRYAKTCMEATNATDDEDPWTTNEEELKAFIGFTMLMGINRLPNLYDYWSVNPSLHCFSIASRISRKRFCEIKRYLHFVDNDTLVRRGEEGYSRLQKIQPVIDEVKKAFLSNYSPHRENSIDEAMIKFKGRSSLKQVVRDKPIKRGIKVWVRADSKNGYVCEFNIYTGKEGDNTEKSLGAKVVKTLSRELVGGNYVLYFDNYFSSPRLFLDLFEDHIYACGTYQWWRKEIPEDIKQVKSGKYAT